jgi:hypothetical protein
LPSDKGRSFSILFAPIKGIKAYKKSPHSLLFHYRYFIAKSQEKIIKNTYFHLTIYFISDIIYSIR